MMSRLLKTVIIAVVTLAVCGQRLSAQTDAQLSQYYEVPSYYNPGAIGLEDKLRIRAGSRLQWIGIDNAPRTFLATADMPLKLFGKRFGVGLMAQQESAGLFRNLTIGLQAAYKIRLFKGELTAGFRIGYANEQFRGSELYLPDDDDYHEGTDEALPDRNVSGSAFDLGLGVWYTHKWFWAGLSCTHLNQPTISFGDDSSAGGSGSTGESDKEYRFSLMRQMYFMAGSNIPIKNTLFEVMPSMMVKTDFTTWRAELNARVRYKKFITAGLGYRFDDALIVHLGAEYKGFVIGYSYDYPTSAINKASSGSHEIIAGYALKLDFSDKNRNKHKSIRIM